MFVMFLGWKFIKRTKFVKLDEMDLITDRYDGGAENSTGQSTALKKPFGEESIKGKFKRIGMWLFL